MDEQIRRKQNCLIPTYLISVPVRAHEVELNKSSAKCHSMSEVYGRPSILSYLIGFYSLQSLPPAFQTGRLHSVA